MGDAAEQKDAQVGGNEASRMDVDLNTESPPDNAANKVPDDRLILSIDREEPTLGRGCSREGSG